jgi:thiamine biosynthesis protein ThiS
MIIVNGETMSLAQPISLQAWLTDHGINSELIAVEHNQNLLTKEQYASTIIQEGDSLEIVRFVGGG